MNLETLFSSFPPGYKEGDIYKQLLPPDDWYPPDEERLMMRVYNRPPDPLYYSDVTYKEFFDEDLRDKVFDALNSGDEDFVKKAFQLKPGEDGIYLNLNVSPGHPGFKGDPGKKGLDPVVGSKDRRKQKLRDEGILLLASCLPSKGCRSMVFQLGRNEFSAVGCKALMKAIPDDLEDFKLYIPANEIRNAGLICIAQKVQKMKNLKSLHLSVGANLITDQGNNMLAECIPDSIESLSIHMRWNTMVDECLPARERLWALGDVLPNITNKENPYEFWLLY